MKSLLQRRNAQIIVSIVLFVAGALYWYFNRPTIAKLSWPNVPDLCLLVVWLLLFQISSACTFYLLVRMVSVELSPLEWIGLSFVTNASNYLVPFNTGLMVKAVYLKQFKNMPYSRFSAVVAANAFVMAHFTAFLGLAVMIAIWALSGTVHWFLLSACAFIMTACAIPFVLKLQRSKLGGRAGAFINSAIDGFRDIRAAKMGFVALGVLAIAQYILTAEINLVAYRSLGLTIHFSEAMLIAIFASLANFVIITPNNIGIQEVTMAYLYSVFRMDFAGGLVGAGLVRAVHLIINFAAAPVFSLLLLRSNRERSGV